MSLRCLVHRQHTCHPSSVSRILLAAEMVVVPDKVEDYVAAHVKVLHFIAYRKLGMQRVYEAYMADGLQGAYAAWASLPHTEDGFKADPSFATAA